MEARENVSLALLRKRLKKVLGLELSGVETTPEPQILCAAEESEIKITREYFRVKNTYPVDIV